MKNSTQIRNIAPSIKAQDTVIDKNGSNFASSFDLLPGQTLEVIKHYRITSHKTVYVINYYIYAVSFLQVPLNK